jgi:hypothetical protein
MKTYERMIQKERKMEKAWMRKSMPALFDCSGSGKTMPIKKTSNIEDYDMNELTKEQTEVAKKLMVIWGYKGQPFFQEDTEWLNRNLLSVNITIDGITVVVKSHTIGFDFSFHDMPEVGTKEQ